jgi:predicted GIY-YIG superfamily endonuclease
MLDVDNRGINSKFYGMKKIYYVGQTHDLSQRLAEHLSKKNGFISKNFKEARLNLVFVDYVYGSEFDAIIEEDKLKKLSRNKKIELIQSDKNKLINYTPFKAIILKKFNKEGENICIKLGGK